MKLTKEGPNQTKPQHPAKPTHKSFMHTVILHSIQQKSPSHNTIINYQTPNTAKQQSKTPTHTRASKSYSLQKQEIVIIHKPKKPKKKHKTKSTNTLPKYTSQNIHTRTTNQMKITHTNNSHPNAKKYLTNNTTINFQQSKSKSTHNHQLPQINQFLTRSNPHQLIQN